MAKRKPQTQVGMQKVYRVYDGVKPMELRSYDEGVPQHADMLRYDFAFHDPNDISRVIFPRKSGYINNITHARWHSFGLEVKDDIEGTDGWVLNPMDWINYFHPGGGDFNLQKRTLREFLDSNPDVRIV